MARPPATTIGKMVVVEPYLIPGRVEDQLTRIDFIGPDGG